MPAYIPYPITADTVIPSLVIGEGETVEFTGPHFNVTIESLECNGTLKIGNQTVYLPQVSVQSAIEMREDGKLKCSADDVLRHVGVGLLASIPQPGLSEGPGVVVRDVPFGDCNLDNEVNTDDLSLSDIGAGAGTHNEGDALGDFDGDGKTGAADLALQRLAYDKAQPYPPE